MNDFQRGITANGQLTESEGIEVFLDSFKEARAEEKMGIKPDYNKIYCKAIVRLILKRDFGIVPTDTPKSTNDYLVFNPTPEHVIKVRAAWREEEANAKQEGRKPDKEVLIQASVDAVVSTLCKKTLH